MVGSEVASDGFPNFRTCSWALFSSFSVCHSVLLFFCLLVASLSSLQWIAPLLSASCRYFSVFSCLLCSFMNTSATFAGWLRPWSVSHSDTFLLFLSSELQLCIFWKSQIFPLGLGFSWLYLRFAGFYPLSECLSFLYIWSLDPPNYP